MRRKTTAALLAALCDKDITLSDSMSADAELAGISAMLDSMSRAFALYPQGFLAQFRNSVGGGGLCFLLVAHIASDYGVVVASLYTSYWSACYYGAGRILAN